MTRGGYITGLLFGAVFLLSGCREYTQVQNDYRITGIEQLDAGNYSEAIQSFDQALNETKGRIGSFQFDVLKYRAEAEFEIADYDAAIHTYDILTKIDQVRPEYDIASCLSYLAKKELAQAQPLFVRAYNSDMTAPGTAEALSAFGAALEEQGDSDRALVLYQQALSDGIAPGEMNNRIGLYYLRQKDYTQAQQFFDEAIRSGEEKAVQKGKYNQAIAYEYNLDFAKALELFEAYRDVYGANDDVDHEIMFLKTRETKTER